MEQDRSSRALARIEAALQRIEAASRAPRTAAPGPAADLAGLQARHERLRGAVRASLSQLDTLIEGAGG